MKILLDENIDNPSIPISLREMGYQVTLIAERTPGMKDPQILELATQEGMLLLTEDDGKEGGFPAMLFRDNRDAPFGLIHIDEIDENDTFLGRKIASAIDYIVKNHELHNTLFRVKLEKAGRMTIRPKRYKNRVEVTDGYWYEEEALEISSSWK